jgi:hypothetical protein
MGEVKACSDARAFLASANEALEFYNAALDSAESLDSASGATASLMVVGFAAVAAFF